MHVFCFFSSVEKEGKLALCMVAVGDFNVTWMILMRMKLGSHSAPWPSRIMGRDLQSREAECRSQGSRAHAKGRQTPSFEVSGFLLSRQRSWWGSLSTVLNMESPVVEPRLCPFTDQNLQKWCWPYFLVLCMCVSCPVVSDSQRPRVAGSSVRGVLQASTQEWASMAFSRLSGITALMWE